MNPLFQFDEDLTITYTEEVRTRFPLLRSKSMSFSTGHNHPHDHNPVGDNRPTLWKNSYDLFGENGNDYLSSREKPASLPDIESRYVGLPSLSFDDSSQLSSEVFSIDQSSQEEMWNDIFGFQVPHQDPIFGSLNDFREEPRSRSMSVSMFSEMNFGSSTPYYPNGYPKKNFSDDLFSSEEVSRDEIQAYLHTQESTSAPSNLERRYTADDIFSSLRQKKPTTTGLKNSKVTNTSSPHRRIGKSKDRHSQYVIDLGRVIRGKDRRTTIMIRNIPNKYDQTLLLETINENFYKEYDFFYLPMDFKNHCNVGYAFINFISPSVIPRFCEGFDNKTWARFKSVKVCELKYGRIQGKMQLIEHFKSSRLMNENPEYRPVSFYSDGPSQGEIEPFPTL